MMIEPNNTPIVPIRTPMAPNNSPMMPNTTPMMQGNSIKQNPASMQPNNTTVKPDNTMMKANCIPQETVLKDVKLAHAYVPFQILCNTFTPIEALKNGTAFPPLTNMYLWDKNKMGASDDE